MCSAQLKCSPAPKIESEDVYAAAVYELRNEGEKEQRSLWIQHLGRHPLPESASPRKSALWTEFFTQGRVLLLCVENHPNPQVTQIGCSRILHGGKGASGFRQDHGNSGGSGKNMGHPAEKCT